MRDHGDSKRGGYYNKGGFDVGEQTVAQLVQSPVWSWLNFGHGGLVDPLIEFKFSKLTHIEPKYSIDDPWLRERPVPNDLGIDNGKGLTSIRTFFAYGFKLFVLELF